MSQPSSQRIRQLLKPACGVLAILTLMISSCAPLGPAAPPNTATPALRTPSSVVEKATPSDATPLRTPVARSYPIVLSGHTDAVKSAEYSPDGDRVVTASSDQTAVVWDVAAASPVTILRGHSEALTTAHFDAAGDRVVTAGFDGTARVWDAASGMELAALIGHESIVNDARFDPAGDRVVTAGEDMVARVWDAQTGDLLLVLDGNAGPVNTAVFSPDGSQVATANDDGSVRLWDATDGNPLLVLPESVLQGLVTDLAVLSLTFSPDGSELIAAGEDGAIVIWDTKSGADLERIIAHGRGVTHMDVSSDGSRIASASLMGGVAATWNTLDGTSLAILNVSSIIYDVALSPDGALVATAATDPVVRLWDAASGDMLAALEGHTGIVHAADFSPDGGELVTAGADGTARVWDTDATGGAPVTGEPVGLSSTGPWWVGAGAEGMWAVNVDGTGMTIVSDFGFGHDPDITGWAAPLGGRIAYLTAEDDAYHAALHIVALPNLREEANIPLTTDATEPARDAAAGDPQLDAVTVVLRDDSLAWSPDGRWLAFNAMIDGPSSDLYVYDTATGQVTRLTDGPTQAATPLWSPDGRWVLHAALAGANIDTGMHVQAFWTAAADGSAVILVNEGEDVLIDWVSATEFALHSIDTLCGQHNLRVKDLAGEERAVWEGYFNRVDIAPESGAALVALWTETETATCNEDQRPGLYLINTGGAGPRQIVEDEAREIVWSPEAQLFFARTDEGTLAISQSGDFIDLAVPEGAFSFPRRAATTADLVWRGTGVWISRITSGLDDPPRQIYSDRTTQAQWTPDDGRVLFVTADGELVTAQAPGFMPAPVSQVGHTSSAAWVRP